MSSTERIKAQILRQAVETNIDDIHGRLPKPLRAPRRRARQVLRWAAVIGLPTVVAAAMSGIARPPASVVPAAPPVIEDAPARSARPGEPPDPATLKQRFPPAVLALGVRRVIIDAGHGGEHLGTLSATGTREKDLTLDIAARLRPLVIKSGFEAVLTRSDDRTLSLQERAAVANGRRGDIFVSIHLNSLEPKSLRGIETFYLGPTSVPEQEALAARENQHSGYSLADSRALLEGIFTDARRSESKRLARAVHQSLVGRMVDLEPALVDRGVKTAPFVVLVATEMPAILAEVSCLSNADEAKHLSLPEYRQAIAEALASGIKTFAENSRSDAEGKDGTSGR